MKPKLSVPVCYSPCYGRMSPLLAVRTVPVNKIITGYKQCYTQWLKTNFQIAPTPINPCIRTICSKFFLFLPTIYLLRVFRQIRDTYNLNNQTSWETKCQHIWINKNDRHTNTTIQRLFRDVLCPLFVIFCSFTKTDALYSFEKRKSIKEWHEISYMGKDMPAKYRYEGGCSVTPSVLTSRALLATYSSNHYGGAWRWRPLMATEYLNIRHFLRQL